MPIKDIFAHTRFMKLKRLKISHVGKMWSNGSSHTLLVGALIGMTTLENYLSIIYMFFTLICSLFNYCQVSKFRLLGNSVVTCGTAKLEHWVVGALSSHSPPGVWGPHV